MKSTLFRRQLVLTAVIMLTFVVLGLIASVIVGHFQQQRIMSSPFVSFARLIDTVSEKEHVSLEQALSELLQQTQMDRDFVSFSVHTRTELPGLNLGTISKIPEAPYESFIEKDFFGPPNFELIHLKAGTDNFLVVKIQHGPDRRGRFGALGWIFGGFGGPPMRMGPPPGGERPMGPPPGGFMGAPNGPPPPGGNSFLISFLGLIISVLLGSAVSVFMLFYSLREKAALVDHIISEMQSGNLKIRFPVAKLDEAGQLMTKFNTMAEEIERLVERLKATELARIRMLQELAHDLRTPIASLRNFNETLTLRKDVLAVQDRDQLLSLSQKEIEYVENLVEDLLFLAQVTDPKYHANFQLTDISDLIGEELIGIKQKYQALQKPINVKLSAPEGISINGDPHLLRRLFRNALENACSFAECELVINVTKQGELVRVVIIDDGPGLTPESIARYGEKRTTRAFSRDSNGRLSVGLGSVIMKAIVEAHQGSLAIKNHEARHGAELSVQLHI